MSQGSDTTKVNKADTFATYVERILKHAEVTFKLVEDYHLDCVSRKSMNAPRQTSTPAIKSRM